MDRDTRIDELSKIVWRWRSGQLLRRTALRLLTSLGISFGGGLATVRATRGMEHHPGHFEEGADPDATDAETKPVNLDVDMGYDPDLNHLLKNPERGMYFDCVPKKEGQEVPDVEDDYYCSDDAAEYACTPDDDEKDFYTIISRWLWLADWCDKPLTWDGPDSLNTSDVLKTYAKDLEFYRSKGYKVLFRPRYDKNEEGNPPSACGYHADRMDRQENHIDEIAKMLGHYKDVIAFIQAGYLGKWGEWNEQGGSSTAPFLFNTSQRNQIIDRVLTAYGDAGLKQQVEMRRPVFVRDVIDRYVLEQRPAPNLGLHNDCFMTSGSDSGTYSDPVKPPFDLDSPTFPGEDPKIWAQQTLTPHASFGGETCPVKDDVTGTYPLTEPWRECSNMVDDDGDPATVNDDDPATLHMSYLNGDYAADIPDAGVLGAVSTWQCGGCYDEIRRRLGYRFEVVSVEYTRTVGSDQKFFVRVAIKNTGWARLNKPRQAIFVLRDGGGPHDVSDEYVTSGDVASWAPGETTMVSVFAPARSVASGTYSVRLWIPDPDAPERVPYAVKLATLRNGANVFDSSNRGENDLDVKITVDLEPPVISGVFADNLTGTSASISWQTSELADSQVAYGPSATLGSKTPLDPTLSFVHRVNLSNLDPDLPHYQFEVRSRDAAGNLATASGGFAPPPTPG